MANPILNQKFSEQERVLNSEPMTINGTIQTTAILGVLLVASAAFVWGKYTGGFTDMAMMLTYGGLFAGFIMALIISFARVKVLIPLYAVSEGLALGGLSAMFESMYPGIVTQAVAGTMMALFSMLFLYKTGVIKATDRFRSVIFIMTLSILGVYIIDWIGMFFGLHVPLIHSASPAGILISVLICGVAALNLIIDFSYIEQAAQNYVPKDYEWFGAFGLMVTIVWLYIEILNLLAKLNRR